jgi:hypothetical protein
MAKKPITISIKDLSKAVEGAVNVASKKNKVQFSPGFRIVPGTIIGRQILHADMGLKQAEQIATEITRNVMSAPHAVALGKPKIEPAVLIRGGEIIMGMFPSFNLELE